MSTSVRVGRRRWCRPGLSAATALPTRPSRARRSTGRGSSSSQASGWSAPTPIRRRMSMSVRVGRRRWCRRAGCRRAATSPCSSAALRPTGRASSTRLGERGVLADTDWEFDVYERSGGQTTLVSTGPFGGNGAFPRSFAGVSEDGARVFFANGGTAGERRHRRRRRTSMSVRVGRRRWSRPVPRAATAPRRRPWRARRPTGRGSSSKPWSRW